MHSEGRTQLSHYLTVCVRWVCPNLCNPLDYNPPGSSVHGISQASILEWVAISSSRGSSWPKDQTLVSYIVGRFCTIEPSEKSKLTANTQKLPNFSFWKCIINFQFAGPMSWWSKPGWSKSNQVSATLLHESLFKSASGASVVFSFPLGANKQENRKWRKEETL